MVLYLSGIDDVERRTRINRLVTKHGGKYVKIIERPVKVTHLVCGSATEDETEKMKYAEKFNQRGEAKIRIVWEEWFWDSLDFGGAKLLVYLRTILLNERQGGLTNRSTWSQTHAHNANSCHQIVRLSPTLLYYAANLVSQGPLPHRRPPPLSLLAPNRPRSTTEATQPTSSPPRRTTPRR